MASSCAGLVVGSLALSLAGVDSVRQRMAAGSASAVHVMDTISQLLQQQGMHTDAMLHEISQLADASVTPGAEGSFAASLKVAVDNIESKVEKKIKDDQKKTQAKLDAMFQKVKAENVKATAAKQTADGDDKTYFECVAAEQGKRQSAESAEKSLSSSRSNENEACQLQQDNKGFAWAAAGKGYNLKFECDFSKGDCTAALTAFEATIAKTSTDAGAALKADQGKYSKLKASCDGKKKERVAAQSALNGAEADWGVQRSTCSKRGTHREQSMCACGKELQDKCAAEDAYKKFLVTIKKADGDHHSEVDRIDEWKSTNTAKCLIKVYMQRGFHETVTAADADACASKVAFAADVGHLNTREKEFAAIASTNGCTAGPMKFFNGQAWNVPAGAKPKASAYTRAAFAPQVSIAAGSDPFPFCSAKVSANSVGAQSLGVPSGSVSLHLVEDGACGISAASSLVHKAASLDKSRYHVGATVSSWGCDRVAQMKAKGLELLQVGAKQYVMSSC